MEDFCRAMWRNSPASCPSIGRRAERINPARVLSVGYLEDDDESTPVGAFDAVVRGAASPREDPCLAFRKR